MEGFERGPTPTSSWVLPKKLIGGRFPSRDDVSVLQKAGVTLFVNLCEPWEYNDGRRQRAIDYHVENRLCFAIPDRSVPEDEVLFIEFVANLVALLERGEVVFVHCLGGAGRTGIVLSCVLLQLNEDLDASKALELVDSCYKQRVIHDGSSPEFEHQRDFVASFYKKIRLQ